MRAIVCLVAMAATPAFAQGTSDVFADGAQGAKVHVASRFVCPLQIGRFERDAVGGRDPESGSDFCAYSARDGVYGTITLALLSGPYDPKTAMVPEFVEQEGIGGKMIAEGNTRLGDPKAPFLVYSRTYETTALEDLHYRIQFAGSAVANWAVQVTLEFASPRDDQTQQDFLNAVYASALAQIGHAPAPASPAVVAPGPGRR